MLNIDLKVQDLFIFLNFYEQKVHRKKKKQ